MPAGTNYANWDWASILKDVPGFEAPDAGSKTYEGPGVFTGKTADEIATSVGDSGYFDSAQFREALGNLDAQGSDIHYEPGSPLHGRTRQQIGEGLRDRLGGSDREFEEAFAGAIGAGGSGTDDDPWTPPPGAILDQENPLDYGDGSGGFDTGDGEGPRWLGSGGPGRGRGHEGLLFGGGPGRDMGYREPLGPRPEMRGDVPWSNYADQGSPNDAFYADQASRLGLQNDQLMRASYDAQMRRANPQDRGGVDPWAWVEGGLPEVSAPVFSDEGGQHTWDYIQGVDKGMSNQDVFQIMANRDLLDANTISLMNQHFDTTDDGSGDWWSSGKFADPTSLAEAAFSKEGPEGTSDNWRNALNDVINNMFTRSDLTTPIGGGPSAAPGYALPIALSKGG